MDDKNSLKENTRHGTVSFPMALYEWNGRGQFRVPPHWHEEMELIYLKQGVFHVWINTKQYVISAPAILCIHAGEIHSLVLSEEDAESAVVFNMNILSFEHYDAIQAKLIGPLMDGRMRMPLLLSGKETVFPEVRKCYEEIEQKIKRMNACDAKAEVEKNTSYLQIKSLLLELLALLYENHLLTYTAEIKSGDEVHIENLKKVISYINENYASCIHLDELAELINLNPQYFCRYFKRNIGKTITEYINEIRIEKAAQELLETDDKIITIAQNAGFDNTGYFIRRFKEEKGMTPSEYRKSQNSVTNSQK